MYPVSQPRIGGSLTHSSIITIGRQEDDDKKSTTVSSSLSDDLKDNSVAESEDKSSRVSDDEGTNMEQGWKSKIGTQTR